MPRRLTLISWAFQVLVAAILFQTLFFKFTGAEESRYIFTKLGAEPWGRWASGAAELIAVVLLVLPPGRLAVYGAALAAGVLAGAIGSHLTMLGLVVQDDGGLLFGLAVVSFTASMSVLWIRRGEIPVVGPRLAPRARAAAA